MGGKSPSSPHRVVSVLRKFGGLKLLVSVKKVYKPKQAPSVPTTNAFKVLNTDVTQTHIEHMVRQHDEDPSNTTDINAEMCIEARPSNPDIDVAPSRTEFNTKLDAFGDLDDKLGDNANDTVEDDWPPLQGEGSSKPSNEFNGIPFVGQQSNTMAMVWFESSSAPTAV
ncbi:hypothetical protein FNV43_RR27131 [Rhamnella rubrinervis]|uniref:Uncharacterized protein n=1 Tax=Rhamnella rubrinervis TaxID=2594499 RepID=A0A8K0DPE4_9ROSA|nr:hypothetical protein FNV43_RR27131 [Rhamnella rubrinervis]